jgi:hypothetical protein
MTGMALVRMISHGVVGLAWKHGSGGRPTDGWQDKSRSLRPGRPAADGRKISALARCALSHDSLDFRKSQGMSASFAHRALGAT